MSEDQLTVEHFGGCNDLCRDGHHYLLADEHPETAAPLGDGWEEIGYVDETGFHR